ncbi:ferredoxin [Streptomyces sp. NPDC050161]|uniref:ferredoxin n=1 Tax=Streptomyces sp. NPDC050161 TaxID=3365604 RepID=UPI0037892898
MQVTIEPDRCVGSGQCVMLAPAVFDQDDDGIVVLLDDRPTTELDGVRESVSVCPGRAISSADTA